SQGRLRAAVIGGGLLGLEAAKALLDLKMKVSVLEAAPILMSAQLDKVAGRLLAKRLEKLGLEVRTGVKLQEVLSIGEDGVRYVKFLEDDQEVFLEVDVLVVSCGIRPRDELARECGLDLGERGGVAVDCYMRSSTDPSIYAVGEVASHEGGMVYGLWKPGAEQAEVLAGTLASPSEGLKYHGSDLSTKLKLLGVDVATFGANAEFWKSRMFDLEDGQQGNICVTTALDATAGSYRKLIFRRCPSGCRRLLGGVLVKSVEDYQSLCDLARCGRELWGLETVIMTHGPRANPGQIEEQVYPSHLPLDAAAAVASGPPRRVVIVGHGPSGHALIQNLVEVHDRPLAITVLCEEPRLAYNRVSMTSYFQHRSADELSLCNLEWLADKNVSVIFARATHIDRAQKRVSYAGASAAGELDYDELVLATGSSPFVPPVPGLETSTPGIFLYRTIEDMDAII
ncbi:nasD, partial [Symbiodinium microadriaticum]